jgi:hypothetical protein
MTVLQLKDWIPSTEARQELAARTKNNLFNESKMDETISEEDLVIALEQWLFDYENKIARRTVTEQELVALTSMAKQSVAVAEFLLNNRGIWQQHQTDNKQAFVQGLLADTTMLKDLQGKPHAVKVVGQDVYLPVAKLFVEGENHKPSDADGQAVVSWSLAATQPLSGYLLQMVGSASGSLKLQGRGETTEQALIVASVMSLRTQKPSGEAAQAQKNMLLALAKQSELVAKTLFEKPGIIDRWRYGSNNFLKALSKEDITGFLNDVTVNPACRNMLLSAVAPTGLFASFFPGEPGNKLSRQDRKYYSSRAAEFKPKTVADLATAVVPATPQAKNNVAGGVRGAAALDAFVMATPSSDGSTPASQRDSDLREAEAAAALGSPEAPESPPVDMSSLVRGGFTPINPPHTPETPTTPVTSQGSAKNSSTAARRLSFGAAGGGSASFNPDSEYGPNGKAAVLLDDNEVNPANKVGTDAPASPARVTNAG